MDESVTESVNSTLKTFRDVRVTVVLPCLNEENAITDCVHRAQSVMDACGIQGEVLVVDNGSVDRSVELAIAAGARVVHQSEPGYGAALRSGFESATTEYVIMADADGTYELEAIPRLITPLIDGTADLIMGSRLDNATTHTMPWLHRFVGTPVITFLVNRAAAGRISVTDSQSGFRAFRREQILSLGLTSTGMEFASEMLIRCAWANFRITEIPTTYSERIGESKLNTFSDGLRHLRQILLLSPDAFASIPGSIMIVMSFVGWILASMSVQGQGRTGSISWAVNTTASLIGVIGPIIVCTGLVLRYRSESLGFRHDHVKVPLADVIKRFFYTGLTLITVSLGLALTEMINFHSHPGFLSLSVSASLSSALRTGLIVGVMLVAAPLISPFLLHSPRRFLPAADVES